MLFSMLIDFYNRNSVHLPPETIGVMKVSYLLLMTKDRQVCINQTHKFRLDKLISIEPEIS